jgi:hypothetical protein
VQYKTPATTVKAKRFMVIPFRLSTVAITPEVLRERYWTMVSIETGVRSLAAIFTRSAKESAFIFRIT